MACKTIDMLTAIRDMTRQPVQGWRCGRLTQQFTRECVAITLRELADTGACELAAEISCPRCDHALILLPYPFVTSSEELLCDRCDTAGESVVTPEQMADQSQDPYNWVMRWADNDARQRCREQLTKRITDFGDGPPNDVTP